MKSIILFVLTISLVNNIYSQNDTCECRVYITSDNYKNNVSVKGEKIDWGIRFTWQGTEEVLKLTTVDSVIKYKAGKAFAYIDTDCKLYRFLNEDNFVEVMYKKNIALYSLYKSGYSRVGYLKYNSIYHTTSNTDYYFSKDFFSPIYKLTKKNLIKVYKDNVQFVEAIKKVKNDGALIKKSADTDKYNIIELYNKFYKK